MSRVAVIGSGYVGLTTAVGLAKLGHEIIATDLDQTRVDILSSGVCPIVEQGMPAILQECTEAGQLQFTTNNLLAIRDAEFIFLCLPTPQRVDGRADLSAITTVLKELNGAIPNEARLVMKSTVPIGTGSKIQKDFSHAGFHYVSNPEFLREGRALHDFFSPDRIVIGANDDESAARLEQLYAGLGARFIRTDVTSAEAIKYASNAFLATKISFINEMATLCEALDANIDHVSMGMGLDTRIGESFLRPGPGWGGSCFPKDSKALLAIAEDCGKTFEVLKSAIYANEIHQNRIVERIVAQLGGEVLNQRIAVLGLTFKAGTDDIRDSPALKIAMELHGRGAQIAAYDPALNERLELSIWGQIENCPTPQIAAVGASMILILTEWPEFASLAPAEFAALVCRQNVFDARNILPRTMWIEAGFVLASIGFA